MKVTARISPWPTIMKNILDINEKIKNNSMRKVKLVENNYFFIFFYDLERVKNFNMSESRERIMRVNIKLMPWFVNKISLDTSIKCRFYYTFFVIRHVLLFILHYEYFYISSSFNHKYTYFKINVHK